MTQHTATEHQGQEAQKPTPEQIEKATAQILDTIDNNPEHVFAKTYYGLQNLYLNQVWHRQRVEEGLGNAKADVWPTERPTEDTIDASREYTQKRYEGLNRSEIIEDSMESLSHIEGGQEAMWHLVFNRPENRAFAAEFDKLAIPYEPQLPEPEEEPLLGFDAESSHVPVPSLRFKKSVLDTTLDIHDTKQSQREQKALIGRKGLRYLEAVDKLTESQAAHLSEIRDEAIDAFKKLPKEKGKKVDASPVIGGILERASKAAEGGLKDEDRSKLREVLNKLYKSNLWEDDALQEAQDNYEDLKAFEQNERDLKNGLTTPQKIGRFTLTTVYEGLAGVFLGRLVNKAGAQLFAQIMSRMPNSDYYKDKEREQAQLMSRAAILIGRAVLSLAGIVIAVRYGQDIGNFFSDLFESSDTSITGHAKAAPEVQLPEASTASPTTEVTVPNLGDTVTPGDTPGIDSVPEGTADTQLDSEATQPKESTVETQTEKEAEVKEHTESRSDREKPETPQVDEKATNETTQNTNDPEAHLSEEQLKAFTIPEGGNGEVLMKELGVDPKEWYKISGDLPQLFPDEFYGVEVPQGFTDVRFKQPGALSPEAVQTISSRLGLWK